MINLRRKRRYIVQCCHSVISVHPDHFIYSSVGSKLNDNSSGPNNPHKSAHGGRPARESAWKSSILSRHEEEAPVMPRLLTCRDDNGTIVAGLDCPEGRSDSRASDHCQYRPWDLCEEALHGEGNRP